MNEPKPIEAETRGGSCAPASCSVIGRDSGDMTEVRTVVSQLESALTDADIPDDYCEVMAAYEIESARRWSSPNNALYKSHEIEPQA